jgi:glucose/arabinose dehydrogenase
MFSLKNSSLFVVLALAACNNNSSTKNTNGGNGGDTGEGGASSSGGTGDGGGGGGNVDTGGNAGQAGKGAGGSGGSPVGGQGGTPSQMGGTPGTGRPMVTNKGICKPPGLKLTRVGKADSPMQITQGKGDDFMLVAERNGRIQRLKNGALEGVFGNFSASVETAGDDGTSERGLLGLALHPDYETNGRFFVYYNRRDKDPYSQGAARSMVIAEGKRMAADKTKADPKLTSLLVIPAGNDHHIGGFLAVGRDGYLYAGLGDSGGDDNVRGIRSRDFSDLRAKVLRIDVDAPTRKVPGNLDKPGAAPQVWVYGVRNPFRGSFDSATGDLYLGDVGEFSYEEINYVEFGKAPDPDWGWYLLNNDTTKKQGPSCCGQTLHNIQTGMEGLAAVPFFQSFEPKSFGFLPIKSIPHDGAGSTTAECSYMMKGFACFGGNNAACSRAVVGGVVYRGKKMPDLDGRYIYGEHVQNTVDSFIVRDGAVSCEASLTADLKSAATPLQGITSFGTDKDGEVYITDLAGGNIYRIDPK